MSSLRSTEGAFTSSNYYSGCGNMFLPLVTISRLVITPELCQDGKTAAHYNTGLSHDSIILQWCINFLKDLGTTSKFYMPEG